MGDSAALNQKKRKIALDPDQEDEDPSRTITVKTANENLEKDEYKHDKDKKDTKKPENKPAEETKKADKPIEKPKSQPDKNTASEKKPEKTAQNVPKNGDKKDKPAPSAKEGEKRKSSEPPKKRKISSSSSSSDSDSSDSDSDSSDSSSASDKKKKKKKPTPKKETKKAEPAKIVKPKDALVYDVLKRWWYCMEDWPPKEFDYTPLLTEKGLRKVDIKSWKLENEEKNGLHKVFEVPSYPGLFKNSKGELFDLRPKETCPCYDTLRKKSALDLLEMLIKAYTNQISALEKSEHCDPTLLSQLKKELFKAEKNYEANKIRAKPTV